MRLGGVGWGGVDLVTLGVEVFVVGGVGVVGLVRYCAIKASFLPLARSSLDSYAAEAFWEYTTRALRFAETTSTGEGREAGAGSLSFFLGAAFLICATVS